MKRILYAIAITIITILFTACVKNIEVSDKSDTSINNLNINYSTYGVSSDDGYYDFLVKEQDYYNIVYTDFYSMNSMFLCPNPQCAHNNDTCPSYIINKSTGTIPYVLGDKLCLIYASSSSDGTILPRIDTMDLNGANSKTIKTFSADRRFYKPVINDEQNLYLLSTSTDETDGKIKLIYEILKCDILSGECEIIYKDSSQLFIMGCVEDNILFKKFSPTAEHELYYLSTTDNEAKLIKSWQNKDIQSYIFKNLMYYFDTDGRLFKLDFLTNEEVLLQENIYELFSNENDIEPDVTFEYADENGLILEFTYYDKWSDSSYNKLYAVNMQNKESYEFTLVKEDDRKGHINVIEIVGENYIVNLGSKKQKMNFVSSEGIIQSYNMSIPAYGIIAKDDYWNNKLIFIEINYDQLK